MERYIISLHILLCWISYSIIDMHFPLVNCCNVVKNEPMEEYLRTLLSSVLDNRYFKVACVKYTYPAQRSRKCQYERRNVQLSNAI